MTEINLCYCRKEKQTTSRILEENKSYSMVHDKSILWLKQDIQAKNLNCINKTINNKVKFLRGLSTPKLHL